MLWCTFQKKFLICFPLDVFLKRVNQCVCVCVCEREREREGGSRDTGCVADLGQCNL